MKTEIQFKNSYKNTNDMYVSNNKFKIWHNRFATNRFLYQFGILYSPNCIYCNEEVNITHAFFSVNKSKGFVTKLKFLQKI